MSALVEAIRMILEGRGYSLSPEDLSALEGLGVPTPTPSASAERASYHPEEIDCCLCDRTFAAADAYCSDCVKKCEEEGCENPALLCFEHAPSCTECGGTDDLRCGTHRFEHCGTHDEARDSCLFCAQDDADPRCSECGDEGRALCQDCARKALNY